MNIFKLNPLRLPLIPIRQAQWFRCKLPGNLLMLRRVDAYIALTFGIGPGNTPGRANEQIAEAIVFDTLTVAARPVIAQREVYNALPPFFKADYRVFCTPGPNERINGAKMHRHSSDSIEDVLAICNEHNWNTIALCGHKQHMPRVMWCLKRKGKAVLYVDTGAVGYCPNSTQWWCRNKFFFVPWELGLAIPYYTLTGKI